MYAERFEAYDRKTGRRLGKSRLARLLAEEAILYAEARQHHGRPIIEVRARFADDFRRRDRNLRARLLGRRDIALFLDSQTASVERLPGWVR